MRKMQSIYPPTCARLCIMSDPGQPVSPRPLWTIKDEPAGKGSCCMLICVTLMVSPANYFLFFWYVDHLQGTRVKNIYILQQHTHTYQRKMGTETHQMAARRSKGCAGILISSLALRWWSRQTEDGFRWVSFLGRVFYNDQWKENCSLPKISPYPRISNSHYHLF